MSEPVVLVGLMGSGKTSVGTRLATALGRELRDSDETLERRYGQTAAEQVEEYGAAVLHVREAMALRDALAERPPPVIAAAASVVDNPAIRAAFAGGYVVWLYAPPRVLAGRISGGDDHRPHYHPDLVTMLSLQYELRAPRFREVADLTVDVSEVSPDEVTAKIVAALPETAADQP